MTNTKKSFRAKQRSKWRRAARWARNNKDLVLQLADMVNSAYSASAGHPDAQHWSSERRNAAWVPYTRALRVAEGMSPRYWP